MSKNDRSIKKQIQKETLALLDNIINSEISAMKDSYTVAEIASEVLLFNKQ